MAKSVSQLKFVGPYDFVGRAWREVVEQKPAVYRLRAWNPEEDKFRTIARAGGVDHDGILAIGESQNGRRRLDDFCCAVEGKPRSHRAGLEYSEDWYDFGSVFPLDSLRIEFLHMPSKELAEAVELALLEDYRWRFKDRPPLNSSGGKWQKVDEWLEGLGRRPRDSQGWLNLKGLLPKD